MLELHEELFSVITPIALAGLIFTAGMFYRKVENLAQEMLRQEKEHLGCITTIKQDCKIHAEWDRKIDRELAKISTSLTYLQSEHKSFREEIRRLLKKADSHFTSE